MTFSQSSIIIILQYYDKQIYYTIKNPEISFGIDFINAETSSA